jgi:uncharacterized alkaline shock family protein YloU
VKRIAVSLAILAIIACADADDPSTPLGPVTTHGNAKVVTADLIVTNSDDAGPGSFRDAIEQANANLGIRTIGFLPSVSAIMLQSGVAFTGTQDLAINANHATLDGAGAGGTAFTASGGGNLAIVGLTVRNASGQGIQVDVPAGATGEIVVTLTDVLLANNAGHGLLVDDQVNDSDASVQVTVVDSRFLGNGYSVSDRDGIRVNEGGVGHLSFVARNSRSDDNAADGIELDERGDGNVIVDVYRAQVTRNGKFDPADLDDGFDIDEAGPGSIVGQVVSSSANHNFEEGLDFNENDAGDLRVDLTDVEASHNREEGIDYEEDDDFAGGGDLVTVMDRIQTFSNGADGGDGGLKIREKGVGDLDVTLSNILSSQNLMSGIHVRETEAGDARVRIDMAVTNGNTADSGPGHGIELREGSSGVIALATASDISSSGNAGLGISAENGIVSIAGVKGGANGSGLTGGGATFVEVP